MRKNISILLLSLFLVIFTGCQENKELETQANTNTSNEIEEVQASLATADTEENEQEINREEELYQEESSEEVDQKKEINQSNPKTMKTSPESGDTVATIKTNMGDIKLFFYDDLAPETVKNFVEHAKADKYDGIIFHRVIEDFMIQGGDIEKMDGRGGYSYKGPGTSLKDEFGEGLTHKRGALSMANAGANTGGSQFFIVQSQEGTPFLDGKHAIFGFVYEGMDVVDKIATVDKDYSDKPLEDVVMEDVEIGTF